MGLDDVDLSDFSPVELGLPYDEYRQAQIEAIEFAVNSPKRFVGLALPTGSGKSLVGMSIAQVTGARAAILTGTKGLQEQYLREFERSGLVDIRGKSNYPCADYKNSSCRFGPHEGCRLASGLGCTYESARYRAKSSRLVLTNYAYWVRANALGKGLEFNEKQGTPNPFEILILDEGHSAAEQLASALKGVLTEDRIRQAGIEYPRHEGTVDEWAGWARAHLAEVEQQVLTVAYDMRVESGAKKSMLRSKLYELEELHEGLAKIARMDSADWVVELRLGTSKGRTWEFDCVWPAMWAERSMFLGIPKVIVMSATLRPISMRMLGLGKDSYDFKEWKRVFPAQNTPVYYWPVPSSAPSKTGHRAAIKLNRETTEEDWKQVVAQVDRIIESRDGRKGIIHTGSYERQRIVLAHSKYAKDMFVNTSDPGSATAVEICQRFKEYDGPAILVSPSFATGWDFAGRLCEWQIILKLPYPAINTKVMRARDAKDKQYIPSLVMQELIQACGRASRGPSDRCEVFILDGNLPWFMKQHRERLAPKWWDYLQVASLPAPGPRAPQS